MPVNDAAAAAAAAAMPQGLILVSRFLGPLPPPENLQRALPPPPEHVRSMTEIGHGSFTVKFKPKPSGYKLLEAIPVKGLM